jgi:hypothetical protein
MLRVERQRAEIIETLRSGAVERAVALAREHLVDFPGDMDVRRVLVDHATEPHDRDASERGAVPGSGQPPSADQFG